MATNICNAAPVGHTSCWSLSRVCADQKAGDLTFANTKSDEGGIFSCGTCVNGVVPTSAGSTGTNAFNNAQITNAMNNFANLFGEDNATFKIFKGGKGLNYALGVVAISLVMYLLSMTVARRTRKVNTRKAQAAGVKNMYETEVERNEAIYGSGFFSWVRVTMLNITGYVNEDGTGSGFLKMLRNVQPWELMYCTTCGVKFVCGDEMKNLHFLRWARFYFGMCLSLGMSIMFTSITYDTLFNSPSCTFDATPGAAAGGSGAANTGTDDGGLLSVVEGYLPIDKFTQTYLAVFVLVKIADMSVASLTRNVTKYGYCASFLARVLILALGLGAVGVAILIELGLEVDFSTSVKLVTYIKLVSLERIVSWMGLTPLITLGCYLTGRLLHKPPPPLTTGADITGTGIAMGSGSGSAGREAKGKRGARSTVAANEWGQNLSKPLTGV